MPKTAPTFTRSDLLTRIYQLGDDCIDARNECLSGSPRPIEERKAAWAEIDRCLDCYRVLRALERP